MAGWCISRKHKQTVNSCVCVCEGGVLFYWKHISGSRRTLYACVWADLSRKASCIWQRLCLSPDVYPLVSPCVLSCGITGESPSKHWCIHTTAQTDLQILIAWQAFTVLIVSRYNHKCLSNYRTCFVLLSEHHVFVHMYNFTERCVISITSMSLVSDHQSSEMWIGLNQSWIASDYNHEPPPLFAEYIICEMLDWPVQTWNKHACQSFSAQQC